MEPIDDLVRRLKKAKNVSELARLSGLNRSTVRRIRDEKHAPNMATFEALMRAVKEATKRGPASQF